MWIARPTLRVYFGGELGPYCYHTVVRFESPASLSTTYWRKINKHENCNSDAIFFNYSTNLAHTGHVEEVTQDRYPPQEVNGHREESTKQQDEAVRFDEHSDQRKAQQYDQDSAKECNRRLDLVLLEKEPERPLEPDHASQPADEEDLQRN